VEVYTSQHNMENIQREPWCVNVHTNLFQFMRMSCHVMSRVPYSISVHIGLWMIAELHLLWEPRWVPCFIFGKAIEIHQLLVTFVLSMYTPITPTTWQLHTICFFLAKHTVYGYTTYTHVLQILMSLHSQIKPHCYKP